MAEKMKLIQTVASRAAEEITGGGKSWMGFLETAARIYKYPFRDQLLIYAQNPRASACASLTTWNERMGRWVNKGAKGIALIDDRGIRPRLTYVFDVSDTHKNVRGKDPYIWSVKEEDWQMLTDCLGKYYRGMGAGSLKETLIEVAKAQVEETADSYLESAKDPLTGNALDGTDTGSFRQSFKELFRDSLTYMLLTRCGLETDEMFGEESFAHISEFSNIMILVHLGNAISETARDMLWDIGHLAHHIAKARIANRGVYQDAKTGASDKEPKGEEKDDAAGNRPADRPVSDTVHGKRRNPLPQPDTGRDAAGTDRQIRQTAEEIPAGTQTGNLPESSFVRSADGPLATDRPSGGEVYGSNCDTAVKRYENGTESEVGRPQGMEKRDGPDQGKDPRSDHDHAGQHLTGPVYSPIKRTDSTVLPSLPYSHGIPLPVVDEVLRKGGNKERGELRIAAHFLEDTGDDAAFLRGEYGKGGQSVIVDGRCL